jgi:hypothetical protein
VVALHFLAPFVAGTLFVPFGDRHNHKSMLVLTLFTMGQSTLTPPISKASTPRR